MNEDKEVWGRLAGMEQDLKSVHRRLDNLESLTESVHVIATELKETRADVADVKHRINDVENQPKKRYDMIVSNIITLILGAVAAVVFMKIGLK